LPSPRTRRRSTRRSINQRSFQNHGHLAGITHPTMMMMTKNLDEQFRHTEKGNIKNDTNPEKQKKTGTEKERRIEIETGNGVPLFFFLSFFLVVVAVVVVVV
jgi:hypothetical protein